MIIRHAAVVLTDFIQNRVEKSHMRRPEAQRIPFKQSGRMNRTFLGIRRKEKVSVSWKYINLFKLCFHLETGLRVLFSLYIQVLTGFSSCKMTFYSQLIIFESTCHSYLKDTWLIQEGQKKREIKLFCNHFIGFIFLRNLEINIFQREIHIKYG